MSRPISRTQDKQPVALVKMVSTKEGYDLWAPHYEADGNPLTVLEEKALYPRLGDVSGLDILDLGCGTGRHSLKLAGMGARVTGVDFSEGMLKKARKKPGARKVRFVRHDLSKRLPFSAGEFDRLVCSLVIEHIPGLLRLFREMRRVCRPDGSIFISELHPSMRLRGVQARFLDPASGHEIRPKAAAHRVSDYVLSMVGAGLLIDEMDEYPGTKELARSCPRAERYIGWPMLLTFKLSVEGRSQASGRPSSRAAA